MLPDITTAPSSSVVLSVVLTILIAVWLRRKANFKKLPPGPRGLPLVGYLPFLTSQPHVKLLELKKKYGPVYTLRLGVHDAVILTDYGLMKDAFSHDAFFGRPASSIIDFNKETVEFGAFAGLPWKEQRRFALQVLRDLGISKSSMEVHVTEEIHELLERISQEQGKAITIVDFLSPSVSNNITSLVFGKRRRFDDPIRIKLDQLLNGFIRASEGIAWVTFFPSLKPIVELLPFGKSRVLKKCFSELKALVRTEIEEHKKTFDPSHMRDFIDRYLVEIEKRKNDDASTFKIPILEDIIIMFFGGGSETIRTTVDWLLLIVTAMPEVQRKVQAEIDDVIGAERFPSRQDHHLMPYTEAVIMETLRWRTITPISLPRYTLQDAVLNSYDIPKHTQVIASIWAVHFDPKLWGPDVDSFKPERFLSENGKEVRKPEYYVPFSVGKRICPGESLAYMEVFMYFTAILQRFNVLSDESELDLNYDVSMVLSTKPHKLRFEPRSATKDVTNSE